MMKRILIWLTTLVVAVFAVQSEAAPARALLVGPRKIVSGDDIAPRKQVRDWQMQLDEWGVYYDYAAPEGLLTQDVLTGRWHYTGSLSGPYVQYDVVILSPYYMDQDDGYNGVQRDSLTLYGSTSAPALAARGQTSVRDRATLIFAGPPQVVGVGSAFGPSTSCSTGVVSYVSAFPNDAAQGKTLYVGGTKFRWRYGTGVGNGNERPIPAVLNTSTVTPAGGILRSFVGMRTNAAASDVQSPAAANVTRGLACNDCDSLVAGEGAFADSSVLWTRYIDEKDTHPSIYVSYATGNAFGAGNQGIMLMGQALAIADSLLGRRLIGQRPGWEPIKVALEVNGGFQRSKVGQGGLQVGDGVNICLEDSARYKPMVRDSVPSLGIKWTMTVNQDSISSYPYEANWYRDIPRLKFMPLPVAGMWTGETVANQYRIVDPFGVNSGTTRALGSYGQVCTSSDVAVTTCLLKWAFARVDSAFKGKVCYAIYPPKDDLIAYAFNGGKSGIPSLEELSASLWWSGVRVVVFGPDNVNSAPNTSYSVNGAGAFVKSTDIYQPLTAERRVLVSDPADPSRRVLGSLFYAASQLEPGEGGEYNLNLLHDYAADFWQGVFYKVRLYPDQRYYYHVFRTPNHIFRVPVGSLHGEKGNDGTNYTVGGANSTYWARRWGWWQIKSVVNQSLALNKFAGRELIRWVYVDEL